MYTEMNRIVFQTDDRDSQLDEMQTRITTIAQRLANLSPEDEEESSSKSRVGGITAKECPFCIRSFDASVRANAGNCPGKDNVYEGRDRKGTKRLETDLCPKLKEWGAKKKLLI